jgi:hypothetical protein
MHYAHYRLHPTMTLCSPHVLCACAVCMWLLLCVMTLCSLLLVPQPNVPDLVPMTLCSMMVPVVLRCCSALPALPLHPHLPSLHETHVSSRVESCRSCLSAVRPRGPSATRWFRRVVQMCLVATFGSAKMHLT